MASTVDVQMVVWSADAQFVEKNIRHTRVVVLACVDEYLFNAAGFSQRPADRRNLDELRTGANDCCDLLHRLVFGTLWFVDGAGNQVDDSSS